MAVDIWNTSVGKADVFHGTASGYCSRNTIFMCLGYSKFTTLRSLCNTQLFFFSTNSKKLFTVLQHADKSFITDRNRQNLAMRQGRSYPCYPGAMYKRAWQMKLEKWGGSVPSQSPLHDCAQWLRNSKLNHLHGVKHSVWMGKYNKYIWGKKQLKISRGTLKNNYLNEVSIQVKDENGVKSDYPQTKRKTDQGTLCL